MTSHTYCVARQCDRMSIIEGTLGQQIMPNVHIIIFSLPFSFHLQQIHSKKPQQLQWHSRCFFSSCFLQLTQLDSFKSTGRSERVCLFVFLLFFFPNPINSTLSKAPEGPRE